MQSAPEEQSAEPLRTADPLLLSPLYLVQPFACPLGLPASRQAHPSFFFMFAGCHSHQHSRKRVLFFTLTPNPHMSLDVTLPWLGVCAPELELLISDELLGIGL